MKKRISLLIILVTLLVFAIPVYAQSAVGRIVITNILSDATNFPDVIVNAFILSSDGEPVMGLSKDMLQLIENGNEVVFEMEETASGSHTVLAFDIGNWVGNPIKRNNTILVKDIILETSLHYVDSMNENDFVEIHVIYGKEPILVQGFTNDKQILREKIQQLNWENNTDTQGLEVAHQAVVSLSEQPNTFSKHVIFFSAGIVSINQYSDAEYTTIARKASSHNILFHSIHVVDWKSGSESWAEKPKHISEETGGVFVSYVDDEDLNPLYQSLENSQTIYKFRYRSPIGNDVTQRTVELNYIGGQQVSDTKIYDIDPSLIASANIVVTVNNGENITVNSEKEAVSVPIHVVLNGLANRKITNISFWVNDQEVGGLEAIDATTYTTTWQFSPKNLGLNYGNTAISLVVKAVDEFGDSHEGRAEANISIEKPLGFVCEITGTVFGDSVALACVKSGMTDLAFVFVLVILVLAVLLFLNRKTVAKVGKDVGVRMTSMVERFTNRLKKLEPKARLSAIKGIAEGERKEFELFGETPIGVDAEFSKLVLDNPNISGLHCVFHEDHEGIWSIEDQESTNGTYVNGKRITPFQSKEIESGVLIELAPVEYGGIKFEFKIIDSYNDDVLDDHSDYDDDGGDDSGGQAAVRVTQRNTQPRDMADVISSEDEDNYRPSDSANQRW